MPEDEGLEEARREGAPLGGAAASKALIHESG